MTKYLIVLIQTISLLLSTFGLIYENSLCNQIKNDKSKRINLAFEVYSVQLFEIKTSLHFVKSFS